MYDAGYGSSSRLYEKTASQLGMTPDKYRRGAVAATVRYAIADSPLGRMLIAVSYTHLDVYKRQKKEYASCVWR